MPAAKSNELLKLRGTFKPSRHADRPARTGSLGKPSAWLDDIAKAWWIEHADQLAANGCGRGDRSIVEAAATWFSIWRKTLDAIAAGDAEYRTFCKLSMAWKAFSQASSRLGIGPTERSKIRTATKPVDRLTKFING